MGDETWVDFEKFEIHIWVNADIRRQTLPKRLIGAKKVMFWVYFTRIGAIDIVTLPPGETVSQSLFVDIVLDSLKKKLSQISDSNSENRHFCFWIMLGHI
jgi:hypothetical protein